MALEEKAVEESESPYVSKFLEFFEAHYRKELERLAESYPDKRTLEADFRLLEQFDIELADAVLDAPDQLFEAASSAIGQIEVPTLEIEEFLPHVRFFNIPKEHEPLVRDISAAHLGKLIAVEGVIRQITTVLPKLKSAVWKCKHCGNTYSTEQDDQQLKMPSFCECRHRDFDLVPEQSKFIDSQRIEIQEPLERLKGNEQASTLQVYISDDLVNRVSAGDKTRFTGILRLAIPDKKKTVYGRYLEAFHLEETQREFLDVEISPEEEKQIRDMASSPEIYDKLTKSIAPAIYGHERVKESIILQLFGGVKKNLPGSQVVRGNIHVLLVGDPGTGKSQILQAANTIAPKSIYTAGKTTSLHPKEPIILRESGTIFIRNIGEFVDGFFCAEAKEIVPVDRKVEALCMNPSTLKIEWKPISFVIRHRTDEDLYRFTFETGREITVTGSHSIFTLDDGNIFSKKASDLKEGDCALCPKRIPSNKEIPVDEKLAKFLGYYLAEGHTNENKKSYVRRIGFTLNAAETDIVEDIANASIAHFGKDPCVYAKGENGLRVTIYGKQSYNKMRGILGNAFGLHAKEKRVPEIIFNATESERKAFIKAYIAGDAGVTKSKYLMSDLQYLFLENSVISSHCIQGEVEAPKIKGRRVISTGDTYRLNAPSPKKEFSQRYCKPPISKMPKRFRELFLQKAIGDKYLRVHLEKINNRLLLERLLFVSHFGLATSREIKKTCGKNSLQYYRKRKGLFELKKAGKNCLLKLTETGEKLVNEYLKIKRLFDSDLGFLRIKKIEKIKFENSFVYDVSVPGNESFVAGFGGIICHNSGVGLCIAPGSLVFNDNGFKRIGDFVEENFCNEKAVEEIPNAWANDFDGKSVCLNKNMKLTEGNIHKIWRIKAPEKMVRIRTRLGKQLELTPNTPLIRIKENKAKWVKSADLLQGDFVACSRISPEGNECNTPNSELSESISKIKSLEAKRLKKKPITAEESQALAESDIIWEEIAQKEHFKPDYEFVYDFSVEKNHNFIANGIFVHNTASAVKDDFGEGGWTLKAGALVLASGGVCMVDELDKMEPEDRSAMHEAMEQGMISIAKAGIVTRFKSDTSILAAANPKMSRFEQYTPFIEQINLPASLISRFDLFFMIKDVLDKTKDEAITAHILKTHKGGEMISQYKKKGRVMLKQDQDDIDFISAPPILPELLGKYISYARQNIFPVMSKEAIQLIGDFYIGLRDIGRKEGSYAATHRQLEGIVRLSEASARVRLSDIAEKEDAERAIRLVKASLSDVVTDPETGKIDYDIIMTGQTHTQVTNMRKILTIVREKAKEQDNVPLQDVLNEALAQGIDAERARDLIAKLEKNGELYRPRHNFLKPTRAG